MVLLYFVGNRLNSCVDVYFFITDIGIVTTSLDTLDDIAVSLIGLSTLPDSVEEEERDSIEG